MLRDNFVQLTLSAIAAFSHYLFHDKYLFDNYYLQINLKLEKKKLNLENKLVSRPGPNLILNDIQPYLDLLNELCSMGTPIRKLLVNYLISENFYKKQIQNETMTDTSVPMEATTEPVNMSENRIRNVIVADESSSKYDTFKHEVYTNALSSQQKIKVPLQYESKTKEICNSYSSSMVDEFLFWCIRFEFPENLVKFLLSLLPDIEYKQIFIKSFVSQYSYISVLLLNSKSEHLSSKVVHISVQLFSNEAIAMKALEDSNLLPIILSTLYNMIVTPYSNRGDNSIDIETPLLVKYNNHDCKLEIYYNF